MVRHSQSADRRVLSYDVEQPRRPIQHDVITAEVQTHERLVELDAFQQLAETLIAQTILGKVQRAEMSQVYDLPEDQSGVWAKCLLIKFDLVAFESFLTVLKKPVGLVLVRLNLQVLAFGSKKSFDELVGNRKLNRSVQMNFGGHTLQFR